jgi:hypothetical protein
MPTRRLHKVVALAALPSVHQLRALRPRQK